MLHKPSGLWRVRIELPPDLATGRRRHKEFSRVRESDALAEMRRIQSELRVRGDMETTSPTVTQWLDRWYREIDVKVSKPRTRGTRRTHIKEYLVPALGKLKLDRLDDKDLKKLVDLMVIDKQLTPTTARTAWVTLESALDAAVKLRMIPENRARTSIWRPKRSVPNVSVLTASQAISIIRTSWDDRLALRWQLALLTGMRQGEALGIEIDRIDLHRDTITLDWQLQTLTWSHGCQNLGNGKWECGTEQGTQLDDGTWAHGRLRGTTCPKRFLDGDESFERRQLGAGVQYLVRPKTKRSWRTLPLVGGLRELVEERIDAARREPNPHGLLFTSDPKSRWYAGTKTVVELPLDGTPIDSSTDSKAWHALLARAGVDQVSLHTARATSITLLYSIGVPEPVIMDIVGHTQIATSRGYRRPDLQPAQKALGSLNQLLGIGQ